MSFNTISGGGSTDKVFTAIINQIQVSGVNVKVLPAGSSPSVVYRIGDGGVPPEVGFANVLDSEYLDFYISTGAVGATGAKGETGVSSYEVAASSGYVGTQAEWVALEVAIGSSYAEIVSVAGISEDVIVVATNATNINNVATDLIKGIGTNQPTDSSILNALTNATNAQLREWEAEADALTALSYATEAEDVLVNLVTSDGDGTFTYTPQADTFSSLHYSTKTAASVGRGIRISENFVSTASQTTFTITGGYDTSYTDVFVNGFKIRNGTGTDEVDTSSGTTIVFGTALNSGDKVDFIGYGIFTLADHYNKTEADALLALKADQATTYTKVEVDGLVGGGTNDNLLINTDFKISNRVVDIDTAPIALVSGTYQIDRHESFAFTNTATIQRTIKTLINGHYVHRIKIVATSTATGSIGTIQRSALFYNGETKTYGVWVISNNANARVLIFDGVTATYSTAHTGGGTAEFLSVTHTISASATSLSAQVKIVSDTGAAVPITTGDYIDSTMGKLENGSVATAYEEKLEEEEEDMCQKYFLSYGGDALYEIIASGVVNATTSMIAIMPLTSKMRIIPTLGSTAASGFLVNDGTAQIAVTAISGVSLARGVFGVQFSVASGLTVGRGGRAIVNNSLTARVTFDAEIY